MYDTASELYKWNSELKRTQNVTLINMWPNVTLDEYDYSEWFRKKSDDEKTINTTNKMLNYSYYHWKVMKKNKRKKRNKNLNSKQTVN